MSNLSVRHGVFALGVWLGLLPALSAGLELPPERHPSLLFGAAEVPQLRARVQRSPYSSWWGRILSRVEQPSTDLDERAKIRRAKSLAFAYALSDSTPWAEAAAQLLEQVRFPPRGGDLGEPHIEGEAVALYAEAYDLIHPYLADDSQRLESIRAILAEEAQYLYDGIDLDLGFLSIKLHDSPQLNNWHLRTYSGLGMAALALADHPQARLWAEWAEEQVRRTLAWQIEPVDGGWAEGPFYQRYAADVYLPFMLALRRLTSTDLLADSLVVKTHQWSVNIRLPNGRRPNVDDAHIADFYGHYLSGLDDGIFHWDWATNQAGLFVPSYAEPDAIALYDDQIAQKAPERGPSFFMPGAGDAVFRSDWSSAATYLLLRGEHGPARTRGFSHEHPDETSFVLYAGGELLVLDGGYINFDNHLKVNSAANHNLVLVDGEGPQLSRLFGEVVGAGNDAYLENYSSAGGLEYAQVRTSYAGVEVVRRLLFVNTSETRFFWLADQLRGAEPHTYTWQLHGNGGGDTGGEYSRRDNGACWIRPGVELQAHLSAGDGLVYRERQALHSFAFLEELTHTALEVEQQGTAVEFLTALYPKMPEGPELGFVSLPSEGGHGAETDYGLAWVRAADADTVYLHWPEGTIHSDGEFGFVSDPDDPTGFTVQGGSYLAVADQQVFAADSAIDISYYRAEGESFGYVRGPETGFALALLPEVDEDLQVSFAGEDLKKVAGKFQLRGEGPLGILLLPKEDPNAGVAAADFNGNGRVDLGDFFILGDHFGQLAEGAAAAVDLDGSGIIDLSDFFSFADLFGLTVETD